ncbi:MAG TPA: radical SAM protein [Syntrophales bacterium]|nr:radical SAM protein [Syntrophales bacterium]
MMPIDRLAQFPAFFIRRKIFRQKIPLLASLKLTYRCNLACAACPFHRRAGEESDQMSWTSAITSLDTLKRLGALIIVFEGGEPLMWQDGRYNLYDLIDYAKRHFPRVAVTTNGTFPLNVPAVHSRTSNKAINFGLKAASRPNFLKIPN